MAKKKKTRGKKFAKQRSGKAPALPAVSLTSRMARPLAPPPVIESTYYLDLADIALRGESVLQNKKKDRE